MIRAWVTTLLAGTLVFGACGGADDDASDNGADPSTATASSASVALDSTFGQGGILASPLSASEHDRFMAVAIANDGSIYAAGFVSQGGDQAMALAKYTAAGALDTTFGKQGVAIVNVAAGGKPAELARAIAISGSGKILIGGPVEHDTSATGDAARDTDIAVVRFDSTGKLDAAFGREGVARVDIGAGKPASATAYLGDTSWGLVALAGDRSAVFGSTPSQGEGRTDGDFVLFSLTSAGALDPAFGEGGKLIVDVSPQSDNPRGLIVQGDGKLVATGYSTIDGVVQPVLIRASATGQLDAGFGSGGVATAKVLGGVAESYAVALQGDAVVSAGYGRGADSTEKVDMILDRWTPGGQWDRAFGAEGLARLDLAREDDRARSVAVTPDGRILAVGSGKLNATNVDSMVALWSKDGKLNTNFGTDGYILSDLGGPADAWFGVAVSPDGKFAIAAGYKGTDASSGGNDDAVLAKIKL